MPDRALRSGPSRCWKVYRQLARHSPCIGICKLDDVTGFCLGCVRSRGEIGDWMSMSEDQRDAVWRKLPERFSALSIRVRLMPWTREELVRWVADSIADRLGTWVTGAPGAAAEFPCTAEREIAVDTRPDTVVAHASDASFRLRLNDKVRAFAFADDGPIVLGLPKGRATLPSSSVVAALGSDADAIDVSHRSDRLFDFGVGRKASRFCVRTSDEALVSTLATHAGRHWSEVMPAIGREILSASPNRIVETAAARIEVLTPIPPPGSEPPAGAHTRFLPAFLQSGEEIEAALTLPDFASPVAIFYPTGWAAHA